jgi:plasmid replication initiation protein
MKHTLAIAMILLASATSSFAQMEKEPRKSPHETIKGNHITVTYGRPYKKGREIFGGLEQYGKVWRTGADEATEITIDKDCIFAGKQLKAGTYTLFTIPEKKDWTIILNSELKQWGAFNYDKIKGKDVLKAEVPAMHLDKTVEQFTITVNDHGLLLDWDHTEVAVPVKF